MSKEETMAESGLEPMIDRALAVQAFRSDRRPSTADRHWMGLSIRAAINSEFDPFPDARGLYRAMLSKAKEAGE